MYRVEIQNDKVENVEASDAINDRLLNSFQLKDSANATQLVRTHKGAELSIQYQWEGKDISANDERGFNGLDQVVSGNSLLVQNHRLNVNFPDFAKPDALAKRTAICIQDDGTWTLLVDTQGSDLRSLAKNLYDRHCKGAIGLDDAGATMHFKDSQKTFGTNSVVSNVIAVMPQIVLRLGAYTSLKKP